MRFCEGLRLEIECRVYHLKSRYDLTEKQAQKLLEMCLSTEHIKSEIRDMSERQYPRAHALRPQQ